MRPAWKGLGVMKRNQGLTLKAVRRYVINVSGPGPLTDSAAQAKHHLERSSQLFSSAIAFDSDQVEALMGKYV